MPAYFDRTIQAYRALETLLADGKVRAIGVSNFMPDHLETLLEQTSVVPAVNQVEVHPDFSQPEVRAADAANGILTQAWSPIGGITFYRGEGSGTLADDPAWAAARPGPRPPAKDRSSSWPCPRRSRTTWSACSGSRTRSGACPFGVW